MEDSDQSDGETVQVSSFVEESLSNDVPYNQGGSLTSKVASIVGLGSPLTRIAHLFENNLTQRDDVLSAMAARNGIYIPLVNYGTTRGYYTFLDGQYTTREYAERILEVAKECKERGIMADEVEKWIRSSPKQVQATAALIGIDIPDDEADEENEYYADRLAFYLRIRELLPSKGYM